MKNLFLNIIALCLLLFITVLVNASTNVSGFINANTTWDIGGSPYIITGNALVSQGFTLTINPGVVVKFDSAKALQFDGELIAIGTPQNRITFTSNQSNPHAGFWSDLHFPSTCVSATFNGNGDYQSGTTRKKKIDPKSFTLSMEQEIDIMVYKLYALTYEEVLVIDGSFGMKREEYEAIPELPER